MKRTNGDTTKGQIPGSVYSFYLESGKMQDPYYRENELDALAMMQENYLFEKSFTILEPVKKAKQQILRFEGIDTISEIKLNGQMIGRTENFHRSYEFEVTGLLKEGKNLLQVCICSPLTYIQEKEKKQHVGGTGDAMKGFPQIRKPHCMFGWDWGPRLPDCGIWKDVCLLGIEDARIEEVEIHQIHEEAVFVTVDVTYSGDARIQIELISPKGEKQRFFNHKPEKIKNPELWWPNGLGEQPLYTVMVYLLQNDKVVERTEKRIGLRSLTIRREKDQWGESFAHEINGQTFFAMGADYIPEDNLMSRITKERTRKLLEDCKLCNFNVIRVWGGGYYPDDFFYDLCDEMGFVVWQDFMFACANYHLDDSFEENITEEITENVKRIRHHASLGLWCGNNEMEMFSKLRIYDGNDVTKAHYIRMFEHIIPKIVKKENPETFYWPSSPSSGGSFSDPNGPNQGDVHYWDVWHGGVPFAEYRKFDFRYLSEFGFQSFPCIKTIESFTLPEDRNIFSRVMERHQRNEGANGKILQYLSMTYLYPTSFELLIYASQLLQADAIRYGVEHFRRNRNDNHCMGAVYWQLNDIWPVASWASIDYYGRWKALHYAAKRFFAPIMISCEEVCEVTARSSVVAEPSENISTARLCVTNESKRPVVGTAEWELRDAKSKILEKGKSGMTIPPFTSVWLDTMDFSTTAYLDNHLAYRFMADDKVVSEGTVLFTTPKHYHFSDPTLTVSAIGDRITVKAAAYARSVEIYGDEDFVLSDNFFDMEAGEKTITVLRGTASDLKVRSVYDIK